MKIPPPPPKRHGVIIVEINIPYEEPHNFVLKVNDTHRIKNVAIATAKRFTTHPLALSIYRGPTWDIVIANDSIAPLIRYDYNNEDPEDLEPDLVIHHSED